ncbi:DTW domain-containing protein [Opitutaceae bacterium TAV4]|nr:DTW domain-containing protein [Opitutaceae bacterium TAV4]RRJ99507.1 DTW domain-containing protein [Opitutaceae bacterium TAV3]
MARSVVLHGTVRCPRCQIAPRWCICEGICNVDTSVAVDVLMHSGEIHRPTSTGNLIQRVMPEARRHVFHHERLPSRESVARETTAGGQRVLWILHPRGEPIANITPVPPTRDLQVLLIDGTWSQANTMLRHVEGWGQRVSLTMPAQQSRYWLRSQHRDGHFSTIEALIFFLSAFGETNAAESLRLQFELHVYASLLARGHKADAAAFLADSPITAALPDLVRKLAGYSPCAL